MFKVVSVFMLLLNFSIVLGLGKGLATPDIPCPNNLNTCVGKADGSVAYLEGICNQYIVCVGGCANILTCHNNLQYSLKTNVCDKPENVNCPWRSNSPATGPSGVACAQSGRCAGQTDGKMLANPNGSGYIVCQCECEIERPCAMGTKFNEQLLTCVNERDNGNGICATDVQICEKHPEGTLLPVDGVCNKFYNCNHGCAVENSCPNNLIFNPNAKYCDYPHNYKCPWPYTPPSGPSAGPSGIACPSGGRCVGQAEGTFLASLDSGSKYVVCQCECEVEMNCPKGLNWDTKLLTCNYPNNNEDGNGNGNGSENGDGNSTENGSGIESGNGNDNGNASGNVNVTVCATNVKICENQPEGSLLPVDGVCNKFYMCNHGCAVENLCPNNLIFNPSAEYCDYPQNFKCPWPYTPPSGPSAGPSGIACPSGGRCVGKPEGTFLSSLNSCSKYVVCQCECEVEMNCSNGLYWDLELSTCNYPTNVKCQLS